MTPLSCSPLLFPYLASHLFFHGTKGSCNLLSNNWQFLHTIQAKNSPLPRVNTEFSPWINGTQAVPSPASAATSKRSRAGQSHALGRTVHRWWTHSVCGLEPRVCACSKSHRKNTGSRPGFTSDFIDWKITDLLGTLLGKSKRRKPWWHLVAITNTYIHKQNLALALSNAKNKSGGDCSADKRQATACSGAWTDSLLRDISRGITQLPHSPAWRHPSPAQGVQKSHWSFGLVPYQGVGLLTDLPAPGTPPEHKLRAEELSARAADASTPHVPSSRWMMAVDLKQYGMDRGRPASGWGEQWGFSRPVSCQPSKEHAVRWEVPAIP